jgi:hypothetical protein
MKCKKGYEIIPIEIEPGKWYMGTYDRKGMPQCRLTDYAPTRKQAQQWPVYRQFYVRENEYCNEGRGCFE